MREEQLKELIPHETTVRNKFDGARYTFMGINIDGTYQLCGMPRGYNREVMLGSFDVVETDRYKRALEYFHGHTQGQLYGQKEAYEVAIEAINTYRGEEILMVEHGKLKIGDKVKVFGKEVTVIAVVPDGEIVVIRFANDEGKSRCYTYRVDDLEPVIELIEDTQYLVRVYRSNEVVARAWLDSYPSKEELLASISRHRGDSAEVIRRYRLGEIYRCNS